MPDQTAIKAQLAKHQAATSNGLKQWFANHPPSSARLSEALDYALQHTGKGVRPFLVFESAALCGVDADKALPAAMAVEAIHTYSLIHDDLPAMDDSPLRRGHPTLHKQFDEATAILAGDALLTAAFAMLSGAAHIKAEIRCQLISALVKAAGHQGMVAGQQLDMQSQQNDGTAWLETMQNLKTGALITWSAKAGGWLAGADEKVLDALEKYGQALGLLFQITDDLLDIQTSEQQLGKPTGQDNNKLTWVSLLGETGARQQADIYKGLCHATLASFGDKAHILHAFSNIVADRQQ